MGGEGGARGQNPVGAGGGARHTLGKRLGHIQNGPISGQGQGGVKGQLRPMGRENTSEVRRKKRKKKPHETTIESFGGLGRLAVGVVYSTFGGPALPGEGWGGLHHSWGTPGEHPELREGLGKLDGDWLFTGEGGHPIGGLNMCAGVAALCSSEKGCGLIQGGRSGARVAPVRPHWLLTCIQ